MVNQTTKPRHLLVRQVASILIFSPFSFCSPFLGFLVVSIQPNTNRKRYKKNIGKIKLKIHFKVFIYIKKKIEIQLVQMLKLI